MYQGSEDGGFDGYDELDASDSTPRATQHIVDDLTSSTKYFVRLHMMEVDNNADNDDKCTKSHYMTNGSTMAVHQKGFYQSCSFWTLPNENGDINQIKVHEFT